jgi:hypothetical protein
VHVVFGAWQHRMDAVRPRIEARQSEHRGGGIEREHRARAQERDDRAHQHQVAGSSAESVPRSSLQVHTVPEPDQFSCALPSLQVPGVGPVELARTEEIDREGGVHDSTLAVEATSFDAGSRSVDSGRASRPEACVLRKRQISSSGVRRCRESDSSPRTFGGTVSLSRKRPAPPAPAAAHPAAAHPAHDEGRHPEGQRPS